LRGRAGLVAHDLQRHPLLHAVLVGAAQQERCASAVLRHQVQRARGARAHLAVRTDGHVGGRHVARPRAPRLPRRGWVEQLGEPERLVLEVGHPDDLVPPSGLCQPRLQPCLHVDVVVAAPRLLHDRDVGTERAEVVA
jgi:hypothetical protein